jgi:hypothetical protein
MFKIFTNIELFDLFGSVCSEFQPQGHRCYLAEKSIVHDPLRSFIESIVHVSKTIFNEYNIELRTVWYGTQWPQTEEEMAIFLPVYEDQQLIN